MVSLKWPKGHKQNACEGPQSKLSLWLSTKRGKTTFGDVAEVGKHQGVLTYSHKAVSVRIPRKHFQGLN